MRVPVDCSPPGRRNAVGSLLCLVGLALAASLFLSSTSFAA
jgi:hypothetical protein